MQVCVCSGKHEHITALQQHDKEVMHYTSWTGAKLVTTVCKQATTNAVV